MKMGSQKYCRATPRATTPSLIPELSGIKATYICQKEKRSAVGLEFHSLGREKADHEYGMNLKAENNSFLLAVCILPCCLVAWSEQHSWPMWTGCKSAWVTFCFGVTFRFFKLQRAVFYSLRASPDINSIVTARHTKGLIMQCLITVIFLLITIIIVLLDKNLESQKKLTKTKKFPPTSWAKFTLSSLQWAKWFSLLQPADFSFRSLNVTGPVLSQHSQQIFNFITDFYCPAQETVELMRFGWGKPLS